MAERSAAPFLLQVVSVLGLGMVPLPAQAQDSTAALRLVVPEGHRSIESASFSVDGKFVATSGGGTRIWETASGRQIILLPGDRASFSPDGRYLITAGSDSAWLWEATTFRPTRVLFNPSYWNNGRPYSTSFSKDGSLVLIAGKSYRKQTTVWETQTGRQVPIDFQDGCRTPRVRCGTPEDAVLSPDGRYLLSAMSGDREASARLWEVATGRQIRRFGPKKEDRPTIAYSPTGDLVATSDGNDVRLWEVETGREARRITVKGDVESIAFSADGATVLVNSATERSALGMKLPDYQRPTAWSVETGAPAARGWSVGGTGQVVVVSPDGRYGLAGSSGSAAVYDLSAGRPLHRVGEGADKLQGSVFAGNGRILTTTADAILWDLSTGRILQELAGKTTYGRATFADPGERVMTVETEYVKFGEPTRDTVRVWDASTGALIRKRPSHDRLAAISADGRLLATASHSTRGDTVSVVEVDSAKTIFSYPVPLSTRTDRRHPSFLLLPRDGKTLVVGLYDAMHVVDRTTGNERRVRLEAGARTAALSADGGTIALVGDGQLRLFDAASGAERIALRGHPGWVEQLAFAPDGRRLATASRDGKVRIWDVDSTGRRLTLSGHHGWARSVDFSPDGRLLVTTGDDNATRVWNVADGRELFSRYEVSAPKERGSFVVAAPDGRFDGTEMAIKKLHYVRGVEPIGLEAFYERFFTPGLSGIAAAGTARVGPDIRQGFLAPPSVRIVSPVAESLPSGVTLVAIDTRDRGGGVQDVRLYHNGALLGGTLRGAKPVPRGCPSEATCFEIELLPGPNVLEATAFARDGTEAERARLAVTVTGTAPSARVHVLAVGINRYVNSRYDLNYARADAAAFVDSIRAGGKGLYAEIQVDTLFDLAATKGAIVSSLQRIAAVAKPQDVFVFFYAGHGIAQAVNDTNQFFLVPTTVRQITDPGALASDAISAATLQSLTDAIQARKRFMVIDACQSGQLLSAFTRRGAEEERALAVLARSSGVFVMSATDSDQSAVEFAALGHGVLTYALLNAMGAAGTPRARTVREIATRAEAAIPDLSKRFRGRAQYPMVWSNGQDFPLVVR